MRKSNQCALVTANPVALAVQCIGSQKELAKKVGVSRQAVYKWLLSGEIPVRRVKTIAKLTQLPAWILCPSVFEKTAKELDE